MIELLSTTLRPEFEPGPEPVGRPEFVRPELLTHPQIPKPMHGVNPRTVMGRKWWDIPRQQAYEKNGFCCWACGVHKKAAEFHNWLEAHESYRIDYKRGRMEMEEIVALCHCCHNFIHSGRMFNTLGGDTPEYKFWHIIDRGMALLKEAGLEPHPVTLDVVRLVRGEEGATNLLPETGVGEGCADWGDWRLVIDGQEFPPKFEDEAAWAAHYMGKD